MINFIKGISMILLGIMLFALYIAAHFTVMYFTMKWFIDTPTEEERYIILMIAISLTMPRSVRQ